MSDVHLPVAHVRAQVASALDVVVHMARLRSGRRVVFQIATVDGLDDAGEPRVTDVFGFRPRLGPSGSFQCAGVFPRFADALAERGEDVPHEWFEPGIDGDGPAIS